MLPALRIKNERLTGLPYTNQLTRKLRLVLSCRRVQGQFSLTSINCRYCSSKSPPGTVGFTDTCQP